ncbi:MAG TPA: hypothetical protein VM841_12140 [Actinomycetota bacterium]|nr:hypothetical protein [Actinomycetota bacterium]
MRRPTRILIAAATLAAASAWPAAAAPDGFGQLAGNGTAAAAGCAGPFTVTGISTTPGTWSFTVSFAGAGTAICAAGGAPVATGAWSPAAGGCVGGSTGLVCVGKVLPTGTPVSVAVSFCIPAQACYSGTASVVRL